MIEPQCEELCDPSSCSLGRRDRLRVTITGATREEAIETVNAYVQQYDPAGAAEGLWQISEMTATMVLVSSSGSNGAPEDTLWSVDCMAERWDFDDENPTDKRIEESH